MTKRIAKVQIGSITCDAEIEMEPVPPSAEDIARTRAAFAWLNRTVAPDLDWNCVDSTFAQPVSADEPHIITMKEQEFLALIEQAKKPMEEDEQE